MDLLLIRHALPERVERDDGGPADPPLARLGTRQARRLAEWLEREQIHALYTSPMVRARETAQPLAARTRLEALVEEGVSEFDRDAASYVPMEELKATDYPAWLELVENGGMTDDVDPAVFQATVIASLDAIVSRHRGETVAVVCHGGVINAWAAHVLGLPEPFFFDPRYTSINRFVCSSRGHRTVASLNEQAHLRGLPAPEDRFT